MILGTYATHSPEWFEARRWRVGGSEIAQACNWSPYGTRADLLAKKLAGDWEHASTRAQERGAFLEASVLTWTAHREGLTIDPAASVATYVHDDHPWALYNPDGLAIDGPLVECKTTADRTTDKGWGRAGTSQVPLYYAAQCQWGMGVTGRRACVLACLHGATNGRPDLGLAIYRLTFDPDAFAFLLRKGSDFITDLDNIRSAAA